MICRCTPGNTENGPGRAMVATLRRQAKWSMPAPGGQQANSCVLPAPFFQGWPGVVAKSKNAIRGCLVDQCGLPASLPARSQSSRAGGGMEGVRPMAGARRGGVMGGGSWGGWGGRVLIGVGRRGGGGEGARGRGPGGGGEWAGVVGGGGETGFSSCCAVGAGRTGHR